MTVGRAWSIAGLAAAGALLAGPAAEASCVHIGRVYTCIIDKLALHTEISCLGAGMVQSCADFEGHWYLVSRTYHPEIAGPGPDDSQLSAILQANSVSSSDTQQTQKVQRRPPS